MSVKMQRVDVSGTAAYPTGPQVEIPFDPISSVVFNEDTTDAAFVSFDGAEDHGFLLPRTSLSFAQRGRSVWLRRDGAGTPPTTIQVIAEN